MLEIVWITMLILNTIIVYINIVSINCKKFDPTFGGVFGNGDFSDVSDFVSLWNKNSLY